MQKTIHKSVANEWVWVTDQWFPIGKYNLEIPDGRIVKVGIGIRFGGNPWGGVKDVFSSEVVTLVGFGSVWAKAGDHDGLCHVSFEQI